MTGALRAAAGLALLAVGLHGRSANAQSDIAQADALLRSGQVARAEAGYFAAARRRPHDPEARFALGAYLASRGAWRVAGVLIEEARRFGGSPARAAAMLAPIYAQTGAYAALLGLGQARLSRGERARALWLRDNPHSFAGRDSVRLPLVGAADRRSIGAIRIVVGSDTVTAQIDPTVKGLIVDRAHIRTPGIRVFDAGSDVYQPAVATRLSLMMLTLRNVPIELGDAGGPGRARVGLDWLARWAPTIDLRARMVTLRRSGRVPATVAATGTRRIPVLQSAPGAAGEWVEGPWIPEPGGFVRLGTDTLIRMRPARITYDPRRGDLLIEQ